MNGNAKTSSRRGVGQPALNPARPALREARRKLGLSMDEAGELIGKGRQLIHGWEVIGSGGIHDDSYTLLDSYCMALEALRIERGIKGSFRIEALCPDLFKKVAA